MNLAKYHQYRAAHICVRCRVPTEGYACEPCKVVLRAKERASRARKRARGECRLCGDAVRPGFDDCAECSAAECERKRAAYQKQRAA